MSSNSSSNSSRISGFHKLGVPERVQRVLDFAGLPAAGLAPLFHGTGHLPVALADQLIENVVGTMNIPLGVATNLLIDGQDYLVPMATEESSVVAAVCNAARQCHDTGGFITSMSATQMIAQVQLVEVPDPANARLAILEHLDEIRDVCNACDPVLVSLGGGFRHLEVRIIDAASGPMVVTHLIVDTRDAMGANAVNSMAEKIAPHIESWTGGRVRLRILSNLADRRLARARCIWHVDAIGGADVRDGIIQAYEFAQMDPYRATTHNKGIMNGVTAVVLATGNDTRAIEAGAHAYAARRGWYSSLTHWEVTRDGHLAGSIEIPMAVGLVGGATRLHPMAGACLKIMRIESAEQLARVIAAVGLAQNFAALKVLATEGVQKGHMSLHSQNIALMAGAQGDEIALVARRLVELGTVRIDVAEQELEALRGGA
ncbi:hydroxymethylglutaryl-CoA reductase, degradative [Castellaniella sp.]|uniref:hydroxymethylglutaryl-CoA reductase, degradative n=1 Tax=Castellaniella sp. TaxID=1955812 RepID=UPI00355DDF79